MVGRSSHINPSIYITKTRRVASRRVQSSAPMANLARLRAMKRRITVKMAMLSKEEVILMCSQPAGAIDMACPKGESTN